MQGKVGLVLGWATGLVVLASIIGGLLVIGSPSKARDEKQDIARLQAMNKTAIAISCYSDNIGSLPEHLTDIKQEIEKSASKTASSKRCKNLEWEIDPISGDEFEYLRIGDHEFQLCAIFARVSSQKFKNPRNRSYYMGGFSYSAVLLDTNKPRQEAGRHCYTAKYWENK